MQSYARISPFPNRCKPCNDLVYNGQEHIYPYIDSWARNYQEGKILYERVKVPIDKPQGYFRRSFLVEDYIVEDNMQ